MTLPSLTGLTHQVVADALSTCAMRNAHSLLLAVDGTCGNGHDTRCLARVCAALRPGGNWQVLACDIQSAALENTRRRLDGNFEQVRLICGGHEHLDASLPGAPVLFAAALYNLGFLPGSDKRAITRPETTLASLDICREHLVHGGILGVHCYGGHPGGLDEMRAVEDWCRALPCASWTVAQYAFCNKARNPETAFLAQRNFP